MKTISSQISRNKIRTGAFALLATAALAVSVAGGVVQADNSGLPDPGFEIVQGRTALVVTDPQNDFLSPKGVTWGVVGKNIEANGTVKHIDQLFAAAKSVDMPVFISPHYYYPHDHRWKFEGALEKLMHKIGMFNRKSPLSTKGRCRRNRQPGRQGERRTWPDRSAVLLQRLLLSSPRGGPP